MGDKGSDVIKTDKGWTNRQMGRKDSFMEGQTDRWMDVQTEVQAKDI